MHFGRSEGAGVAEIIVLLTRMIGGKPKQTWRARAEYENRITTADANPKPELAISL